MDPKNTETPKPQKPKYYVEVLRNCRVDVKGVVTYLKPGLIEKPHKDLIAACDSRRFKNTLKLIEVK